MRLTSKLYSGGAPKRGGMKEKRALSGFWAILLAIFAPAATGCLGVYLAITCLSSYGGAVFLVLPAVVSTLAAFLIRRFMVIPMYGSFFFSLLSIFVLGVFIIAFALDGLGCLIMALPLTLLIAFPAACFGHELGKWRAETVSRVVPCLILLVFPVFQGFEYVHPPVPPVRVVTSRVVIDAPIQMVWDEVIAFDRITKPPEGILRWGIAYPIQAKIYGSGVGAVRHCIFSTGPFVEPITSWQPPYLLEFDVTKNPPPMKELSPYGHIDVPHLHDTFVSRHGRFRLWEENGKVVLEGTTWYYQKIAPDWYWHLFSDAIIHKIHLRVLEQIQSQSEMAALAGGTAKGA